MVDHCDSGCCATWFAGWEKTLESAETIPTAQEMPISHLASFMPPPNEFHTGPRIYSRDSPDESRRGMNPCAFLAFPQDPREVWMAAGTSGSPNGGRPKSRNAAVRYGHPGRSFWMPGSIGRARSARRFRTIQDYPKEPAAAAW